MLQNRFFFSMHSLLILIVVFLLFLFLYFCNLILTAHFRVLIQIICKENVIFIFNCVRLCHRMCTLIPLRSYTLVMALSLIFLLQYFWLCDIYRQVRPLGHCCCFIWKHGFSTRHSVLRGWLRPKPLKRCNWIFKLDTENTKVDKILDTKIFNNR